MLRWQCLQRTTSHSGLAVCDGCWSYLVGSSGRMELTDALQNLWAKELFHHSPTQPPNRATVRGALDRQSYTPLDSLASSPQLSAVIIALPRCGVCLDSRKIWRKPDLRDFAVSQFDHFCISSLTSFFNTGFIQIYHVCTVGKVQSGRYRRYMRHVTSTQVCLRQNLFPSE